MPKSSKINTCICAALNSGLIRLNRGDFRQMSCFVVAVAVDVLDCLSENRWWRPDELNG